MTTAILAALALVAAIASGGNHATGRTIGDGGVAHRGLPVMLLAIDAAAAGARAHLEGLAQPERAAPFEHSIRIHGLSADGIATLEPVATATAEPTIRIPRTVEPTRDAPVFGYGIEATICAYSWPCGEALAVAMCESRLDPNAWNPSGASGVFQVMPRWHGWRLAPGESLFDAGTNVRVAYEIWSETRDWRQWSCKP